ncbi:MAG: hypothetical protein ACE37F_18565 [Nannocystaceae bacterium]|nr:hypothetical protein [bacterium]
MALSRIAGLAAVLLLGCAPQQVTPPRPSLAPTAPSVRIERAWTRHALPAEGIVVHATLWDAALVSAALAEAGRREDDDAWAARYLERTAFTVVIELEDRQPAFDHDPLLAPAGWAFELDLNKGDDAAPSDVVTPSDVDLLLVDRFPTASGSHHHRVAMAVFFEGTLYDAVGGSDSLELVVKPRMPGAQRGADLLGKAWARRGTTLRWRLSTARAPEIATGDH